MQREEYPQKCASYLQLLCNEIPERCVGSGGNRQATRFFAHEMASFGWHTESQVFDAIDWHDGSATLNVDDANFEVFVSPYALGCAIEVPLLAASDIATLSQTDMRGKILLLHGDIAEEQLMPKNFVFYNPEEHQQIITLLEQGAPAAIISATGRNAALAGGVYPFPLFEDGDFDIPSVYMTEEEGMRLLPYVGQVVGLKSASKRVPGKGYNVVASKGKNNSERIVITAHIDAKKGTPGAIDNGTGVVVLLLLAELLQDYDGDRLIELVALNGEDYYAAPGQMLYLHENRERLHEIVLNINIDGAGYYEGKTAFSFYGLSEAMEKRARDVFGAFGGMKEGGQWYQGDHGIFIQNGRSAIAISSNWFIENIDSQEITHTAKDTVAIVDCDKVVEIAHALNLFVRQ